MEHAVTEESLEWTGTPSQVGNLGVYILCALAALTVVLIPVALIVAVWKYLQVRTHKYELTDQRLRETRGVLSRTIDSTELYRIKDTRFEQSFFQRLFGVGDVVLVGSDPMQPVLRIASVADAEALREKLRGLVEARRQSRGVRMIETE
jgi:uncharacterized membrane protein YdbT with pleckstrin-like domain